ncbi:MAG: TVP38/TMEM64 family protein [Chloroflexi bacterium]|nr:TVP38/TMEM64 family protein [Chloroflexota bacterium]
MAEPDRQPPLERGGSRWSAVASLLGLVACGVAFFVAVQMIGAERLQAMVTASGPLAPVVFVLIKALTVVITPLSGTPLRLAAGALFGFWEGVALSVLASVLGGSINFWIARRFGRGVVARLLGPRTLWRVEPMLDRLGTWKALILARVVLAPLWDVLSYGVGLTRLRFRTYATVALIGDVIPTMILVGVGTSVMEVGVLETGTAGAQSVESLAPTIALLLGLGVGALVMGGLAVLLRPRLARLLGRPAADAGLAADTAAPRPRQRRLTLGLSRSKRGARGAA